MKSIFVYSIRFVVALCLVGILYLTSGTNKNSCVVRVGLKTECVCRPVIIKHDNPNKGKIFTTPEVDTIITDKYEWQTGFPTLGIDHKIIEIKPRI